jgi:hypothetical protein
MSDKIDETLVTRVEQMLASAHMDTRAAVAAACLPGRIRAFSPHYAALHHTEQSRLSELVAHAMRQRGFVDSATGITAALAVNWCESRGYNYVVTRVGEIYHVERTS